MDWNRIIDGYCERVGTDPNFWGEPVNAITNAAFLAAALWALHEARSRERLDWSTGLLCVNVFAIGVGSFLFHTFATRWAVMMDVVPIQTMILLYFAAVLIPPTRSAGTGRSRSRSLSSLSLRESRFS